MNKEKKHKNKKFPGFYIALCCCVLAIGAAGYLSERHESERVPTQKILRTQLLTRFQYPQCR